MTRIGVKRNKPAQARYRTENRRDRNKQRAREREELRQSRLQERKAR